LTDKGTILVVIGVSAYIAGLLLSDYQLMFLGMTALVLVLMARIYPLPIIKQHRDVTKPDAIKKDTVRVRLRTTKSGGLPALAECHDTLPTYIEVVSGNASAVDTTTKLNLLEYDIYMGVRGTHKVGGSTIKVFDPMMLYSENHKSDDEIPINVYPVCKPYRWSSSRSQRFLYYPGSYQTKKIGDGLSFYSIRDYIPGDPMKNVNWKVFSRRRKVMVNQFEKEMLCHTVIMLDARAATDSGDPVNSSLDQLIEVLLSTVHSLVSARNQVAVIIYGSGVTVIPPGTGDAQLTRIIKILGSVNPSGETTFGEAINRARIFIQERTTVMLFTSLRFDPTIILEMRAMRLAGHPIHVIRNSLVDFENRFIESDLASIEAAMSNRSRLPSKNVRDIHKSIKDHNSKYWILKLFEMSTTRTLRDNGVYVVSLRPEDDFRKVRETFAAMGVN